MAEESRTHVVEVEHLGYSLVGHDCYRTNLFHPDLVQADRKAHLEAGHRVLEAGVREDLQEVPTDFGL